MSGAEAPARRSGAWIDLGGAVVRRSNAEHAARDFASKRIIAGYGFWIFLPATS